MHPVVRQLFHELADVPPEMRPEILARHSLPADVYEELRSLLDYDSTSEDPMAQRIFGMTEEAVLSEHPLTDDSFGPYRVLRLLASGGMGTVFLAERSDGEVERQVAIKILRSGADRPAWRERFLRERQFLSDLNHPAIPRLLDAGHTRDGRPYLVMEYVDGQSIEAATADADVRTCLKLVLAVCAGVSYAHDHQVLHRDLKPSNILVDSAGNPKILDFGIAKLLDDRGEDTRTAERLLTPGYASPEQLRGDIQTASTDIYSLGAVLYRLLTRQTPREAVEWFRIMTAPQSEAFVPPTSLNRSLPRDLDYILRKALRHDPEDRYQSVRALAADIRFVLEGKPVLARSSDAWYCISKWTRRYPATVAAIVLAGVLAGGTRYALHQRDIAQARIRQVRQLAAKALSMDRSTNGVHSSAKVRREIVAMSKDNLESLASYAGKDRDLAVELAEAYSLMARAEGIPNTSNLGNAALAKLNLDRATSFVDPILKADPANRKALSIRARVNLDRMILAEMDEHLEKARAHAQAAVHALEKLLSAGELTLAEREAAAQLYYDIALGYKNLGPAGEAIQYARRAVEISSELPNGQLRTSMGLSIVADLLRLSGDLEGSLAAITDSKASLQTAVFSSEVARRSAWCAVLWREGKILGASSGLSLNRTAEAIAVLERAFALLEETSANDNDDAGSRLSFGTVGRELGDLLQARKPVRALEVYEHSLRRLREVRNNEEALRAEVGVLASSASVLRRLQHPHEAKARIDNALALLGPGNADPNTIILPNSSAEAAWRAWGDHLAATGDVHFAQEVYRGLLDKVMRSNPDPYNDLRHAVALSRIYAALGPLCRRTGDLPQAARFDALRQELWQSWETMVPSHGLGRRQLQVRPASIDSYATISKYRTLPPSLAGTTK